MAIDWSGLPTVNWTEDRYMQEYNNAMLYGEYDRAENIKQQFSRRRNEMAQNQMANDGIYYDEVRKVYGPTVGLGTAPLKREGTAINQQLFTVSQLQNAVLRPEEASTKVELGVLYLNGKEMPADWAGAKITRFDRGVTSGRWVLTFTSKWDPHMTILLYLSLDEYNGKEVNAMGETYMEALNQRRAG